MQGFVAKRKMSIHKYPVLKTHIRVVLWIVSFMLTIAAAGARSEPIRIDHGLESLPLADQVLLLEDASATLTIEEVSSAESRFRFTRDVPADLDFGYTDSALWFKLDLDWADQLQDSGTPYLLEIGPPKPTNDVFVWVMDENGEVSESLHLHNNQTELHTREVRTLPGDWWCVYSPKPTIAFIFVPPPFATFMFP